MVHLILDYIGLRVRIVVCSWTARGCPRRTRRGQGPRRRCPGTEVSAAGGRRLRGEGRVEEVEEREHA